MRITHHFNIVGRASLPYCPGTHCLDWDGPCPSYLTDKRTGNCFGRLMPRIIQLGRGQTKGQTTLGYQRHS